MDEGHEMETRQEYGLNFQYSPKLKPSFDIFKTKKVYTKIIKYK